MNTLLLSIFLLTSPLPDTGYMVWVEGMTYATQLKTTDIREVERLVAKFYDVETRELLYFSNYFEIKDNFVWVYVEKKRVEYKNGKIKYRKWRDTDTN